MFTAFQRLSTSFGWTGKEEGAIVEAPVIRIPENEQDVPQKCAPIVSYECLSDIFGEMVAEQQNSLTKW